MNERQSKKIDRALIACDSFKGSLSSEQVAKCIKSALERKGVESDCLIISDGGEGYLDALESGCPSLEKRRLSTFDSLLRKKSGAYLTDGDTLYFNLADVVGIDLLKPDEINAYENSTFGLGHLMRKAIIKHCPRKVVLSIGGSCTNDLGLGMLEGMGAEIYGGDKRLNNVTLKDFSDITSIDLSDVYDITRGIEFTTLTDVKNPLLGANGATYIYGEQKGIKCADMPAVDSLLAKVKNVLLSATKTAVDPTENAGSGAAGGVGFTMQAVFGSNIKSGIDELLRIVDFGERVKNYDCVITGEGCLDEQSFNGKVVSGVMKYGIHDLVIVSAVKKLDRENAYSIVPDITTKENSLRDPKKYLAELIDKIF